jgi:hypothetical protein
MCYYRCLRKKAPFMIFRTFQPHVLTLLLAPMFLTAHQLQADEFVPPPGQFRTEEVESSPSPASPAAMESDGESEGFTAEKEEKAPTGEVAEPAEVTPSSPVVPVEFAPAAPPSPAQSIPEPTPAPAPAQTASLDKPASDSGFKGDVMYVDPKKKFVVVDFHTHQLPAERSKLGAYRNNRFVGVVRITPPAKPPYITADVIDGTLQKGDVIR